MLNNSKTLIAEIENLCYILLNYCENIKYDEEINRILTLINCVYSKIEKLYYENN